MKSRTQKSLLLAFILSVAGCGVVGIYCLAVGQFGSFEARILGTALVTAAASILGLVGAISWERRRWHPLGPISVVCTTVALSMALTLIWADPWYKHWFWKVMGVACVAGVALPHTALLSLARLRRQYGWVRRETILLLAMLAASVIYVICVDLTGPWGELAARVIGILSIGVACGTIAIPIMHRVSAIRARDDVKTVELMMTLTCPRCEKSQQLPAGRSRCGQCGLKFNIQIEEEQCRTCGYPLYQLTSDACPECGTPIATRSKI